MELLLDVWEGDTNLDIDALKSAGVRGLIVRLNDMNGGHHLDTLFVKNWQVAQSFDVAGIYFVYNPWVSGAENAAWLKANLPVGYSGRVFADIEVRYTAVTPEMYTAQVNQFLALVANPVTIYTGGWFLPCLSSWCKDRDYWWARYPGAFYPAEKTNMSWGVLKSKLTAYGWYPDNGHQCPGSVKLWQFTADRLILPGMGGRALDVNAWDGDMDSLRAWMGTKQTVTAPLTLEQKVEKLWTAHPELH